MNVIPTEPSSPVRIVSPCRIESSLLNSIFSPSRKTCTVPSTVSTQPIGVSAADTALDAMNIHSPAVKLFAIDLRPTLFPLVDNIAPYF